jgi:hypothetical protein
MNNHKTLHKNEALTVHVGERITFPCTYFFTLSKGEKLEWDWNYTDNTSFKDVYMHLQINVIKVTEKVVYLRETYSGRGYKMGIFEQNNYLIRR